MPYSRVAPLTGSRVPPLLRPVFWFIRRKLGMSLLPLDIMAHSPNLVLPYLATSAFSHGKMRLPAEIRGLAMQLTATLNGCAWCMDFGASLHGTDAVTRRKLAHVAAFASSPLFSPAERAALAYAEAVTGAGARVPDDVFAELRRHFSEQEIVELTAAVAVENFYNRLNAALEVEAQGFCALPARAPATAA